VRQRVQVAQQVRGLALCDRIQMSISQRGDHGGRFRGEAGRLRVGPKRFGKAMARGVRRGQRRWRPVTGGQLTGFFDQARVILVEFLRKDVQDVVHRHDSKQLGRCIDDRYGKQVIVIRKNSVPQDLGLNSARFWNRAAA
jgi:hypothetical protein